MEYISDSHLLSQKILGKPETFFPGKYELWNFLQQWSFNLWSSNKTFFTLTTHYKVSASFCDIKNKTTTHVPLTFKQNKHKTMNIHRGTLFHVRVSILPSVYHEYYALHTAMWYIEQKPLCHPIINFFSFIGP